MRVAPDRFAITPLQFFLQFAEALGELMIKLALLDESRLRFYVVYMSSLSSIPK